MIHNLYDYVTYLSNFSFGKMHILKTITPLTHINVLFFKFKFNFKTDIYIIYNHTFNHTLIFAYYSTILILSIGEYFKIYFDS